MAWVTPSDKPAEAPAPGDASAGEVPAAPDVAAPAVAAVDAAVAKVEAAPELPAAPSAPALVVAAQPGEGAAPQADAAAAPDVPGTQPTVAPDDAQKPTEETPEKIIAKVAKAAAAKQDTPVARKFTELTRILTDSIRTHLLISPENETNPLDLTKFLKGDETVDDCLNKLDTKFNDKKETVRGDLQNYQRQVQDYYKSLVDRAPSGEQASGWKEKLQVTFAAFGEVMKQLMAFLKDFIAGFTGKSGEAAVAGGTTPPEAPVDPVAKPVATPAKKPAAKAVDGAETKDKPEVAETNPNPHPGSPVPRDSITSAETFEDGSIKFTMNERIAVRAIGEGEIISINGNKIETRLNSPEGDMIFVTYEGIEPKGNIVQGMQLDTGTILGGNTEDLIVRTTDADKKPVSPTNYMNLT